MGSVITVNQNQYEMVRGEVSIFQDIYITAGNETAEGDIYIKESVEMGIPRKNLYTTQPVFNTMQEAKAVKIILNQQKTNSKNKIILVTSAFHMKRAKKLFEREGIIVKPYPVDFKTTKNLSTKITQKIFDKLVQEVNAL